LIKKKTKTFRYHKILEKHNLSFDNFRLFFKLDSSVYDSTQSGPMFTGFCLQSPCGFCKIYQNNFCFGL